jgi:hypothetical protein
MEDKKTGACSRQAFIGCFTQYFRNTQGYEKDYDFKKKEKWDIEEERPEHRSRNFDGAL